MKTRKQKKAGFTLVELMVVAIIVAILAAVAIPLMSGNRERAIATEAQAGCSTIANAIKMQWVQSGTTTNTTPTSLPGLSAGDLNGTYFDDDSYSFTMTSKDSYTITATGKSDGDAAGQTVVMTVTSGEAKWSGDLIQ